MVAKADLRNRALRHLGLLAIGQSAPADQAAIVDDAIDEIHEELVNSGHAHWDISDIPQEVVRPLVKIVAAEVGGSVGVSEQRMVAYKAERKAAEMRLYKQVASAVPDEPIKAEYF